LTLVFGGRGSKQIFWWTWQQTNFFASKLALGFLRQNVCVKIFASKFFASKLTLGFFASKTVNRH
jgi:hypothetical protein